MECTLVMGARWYVEYDVEVRRGYFERRRPTAGINRIKDLNEREQRAPAVFADWYRKQQQADYCPLSAALERLRPSLRLSTYQGYKSKLKGLQLWTGGNAVALDPEGAQLFINDIVTYWHPGYASSYRRNLSAVFKAAGIANPFAAVKLQRSRVLQRLTSRRHRSQA